VGVDEEVAIEVLQALEIDNLFDPGRMGAQPKADRVEIGEPEGVNVLSRYRHVGKQTRLVELLEVHRKTVVDLVRYAYGDSVLESDPPLAGPAEGRRVQKADQHTRLTPK
jgi:hypothetical protein